VSEESETIGEDVLSGGYPMSSMPEKKRKELQKKLQEELRKKREEEQRKAELEKLPKESIPGEKPGEMSPEKRAELIARASLTDEMLEEEERVKVKAYTRGYPKKKDEE